MLWRQNLNLKLPLHILCPLKPFVYAGLLKADAEMHVGICFFQHFFIFQQNSSKEKEERKAIKKCVMILTAQGTKVALIYKFFGCKFNKKGDAESFHWGQFDPSCLYFIVAYAIHNIWKYLWTVNAGEKKYYTSDLCCHCLENVPGLYYQVLLVRIWIRPFRQVIIINNTAPEKEKTVFT